MPSQGPWRSNNTTTDHVPDQSQAHLRGLAPRGKGCRTVFDLFLGREVGSFFRKAVEELLFLKSCRFSSWMGCLEDVAQKLWCALRLAKLLRALPSPACSEACFGSRIIVVWCILQPSRGRCDMAFTQIRHIESVFLKFRMKPTAWPF